MLSAKDWTVGPAVEGSSPSWSGQQPSKASDRKYALSAFAAHVIPVQWNWWEGWWGHRWELSLILLREWLIGLDSGVHGRGEQRRKNSREKERAHEMRNKDKKTEGEVHKLQDGDDEVRARVCVCVRNYLARVVMRVQIFIISSSRFCFTSSSSTSSSSSSLLLISYSHSPFIFMFGTELFLRVLICS